jgi:hypothetical protein
MFRCDACGRFVGVDDFAKGALRQLVTPLSDYSREEFETLCVEHAGRTDCARQHGPSNSINRERNAGKTRNGQ